MSKKPVISSVVKQKRKVAPASLANLKPVQPGQVLNPKGRAKGSRNKLGEDFLTDLLEVWGEKGKACIETTAANHPEKLVSIVAGILPKELNVNTNAAEELSDDDLAAGIASLRAIIAAQQAREGSDAETKH
jgi:hypothetical protein